MVEIRVEYEGTLRCRAVHGPSGAELLTDAPVDNQGKGESFSPTDLVATSVATCMLTIMGIAAERHGWDLRGASATVKKHMAADPRRISKVDVVLTVPGEFDDRARTTLERAALTCPVHTTLGQAEVELPVHFEWPDVALT